MVQQTERPIFLPFVSCFGPELFVTPACLAQVQNLPCSSGGTRCFTLHRGWRTDLPTSMLSGCAFFSVSSNSSKISLEQKERPTVKLLYNNKPLHKIALRESATRFTPQTQALQIPAKRDILSDIFNHQQRQKRGTQTFFSFVCLKTCNFHLQTSFWLCPDMTLAATTQLLGGGVRAFTNITALKEKPSSIMIPSVTRALRHWILFLRYNLMHLLKHYVLLTCNPTPLNSEHLNVVILETFFIPAEDQRKKRSPLHKQQVISRTKIPQDTYLCM